MIIINQDKDEIVRFDKADSIWICADEEDKFTIEATSDTNATLGYYRTKERAKEVLQEIVGLYRRCQQVIGEGGVVNFIYPPKVYEMPKE